MSQVARLTLLLLVLSALAVFSWFDASLPGGSSNWLALLNEQRDVVLAWRSAHPLAAPVIYLAAAIVSIGLMLPVAVLLMIAAGAVFGFAWGLPLASFGLSLGGLLGFHLARQVLGTAIRQRWSRQFAVVDRELRERGAWYLLSLRLIPVMPGFVVNLLMGVSAIRPRTFYWVSQVGGLASATVYVNAGTQLARIQSIDDIWSTRLILSLTAVAVLPLVLQWISAGWRRVRASPRIR